jgi:nucleotide-binding universal stress UspA family protein
MFGTILVPVDGSEHSRRALTVAATELEADRIVVLHVIDPFTVVSTTETAVWDDDFHARREREAEALLEEYEELADDLGVSVETELVHGSPANAIIGAVDDFDVDQIVIGSQGRSGIGRILLGSVAETVAKRAPTSVLIARPEVEKRTGRQ